MNTQQRDKRKFVEGYLLAARQSGEMISIRADTYVDNALQVWAALEKKVPYER